MTQGTVYFIQARTLGLIKIGHTTGSVAARLGTLQTGSPDELILLGAMPGTCDDEAALHEQFKSCRLHGEWFRPTPEILALAAGCRDFADRKRDGHQLPARVDAPMLAVLQTVAGEEHRPLSRMVLVLLEEAIAARKIRS